MRNRDIQEEGGQIEEADNPDLLINGVFGGLISVPLPIPEILSTLDRTKFKEMIEDRISKRK